MHLTLAIFANVLQRIVLNQIGLQTQMPETEAVMSGRPEVLLDLVWESLTWGNGRALLDPVCVSWIHCRTGSRRGKAKRADTSVLAIPGRDCVEKRTIDKHLSVPFHNNHSPTAPEGR